MSGGLFSVSDYLLVVVCVCEVIRAFVHTCMCVYWPVSTGLVETPTV